MADNMKLLEELAGPLTIGALLRAIRNGEELTLSGFAERIEISAQNLSDIERGRKGVSPERAARWAQLLGLSEAQFIRLALEDALRRKGLDYHVSLQKAV